MSTVENFSFRFARRRDPRQRTGKREPQPGHARGGQEDGLLHVGVERRKQDFVPAEEFGRTAGA